MSFPQAIKSAAIAALVLILATPSFAEKNSASAVELLNSLGCKGCHRLNGEGGTLGPALDGVGTKMNEQKIRTQLLDPKSVNPGSIMPSFTHLSEQKINTLVDYLRNLK